MLAFASGDISVTWDDETITTYLLDYYGVWAGTGTKTVHGILWHMGNSGF